MTRHSILTLVAAAVFALSGTAAHTQILPVGAAGDGAATSFSSRYTAAELRAMGLRFQAAKNYRNELVQLPTSAADGTVRPDDRGGPHGA
jgi:hypothetical protein